MQDLIPILTKIHAKAKLNSRFSYSCQIRLTQRTGEHKSREVVRKALHGESIYTLSQIAWRS